MTQEQFLQNLESLRTLLNENKFSEGIALCHDLLDNFALLSDADDKEKIFRDIAQMHAVIIIESKIMDRIEAAGDLLEKYGGDGYSMFLRARLLWLREDNFHALALMEDYFKISVVSDDLIIAPESPLWGLSVDMQQLVLNFIGHAYKFFSLPLIAMKCSYLAYEVVEHLPTKWQEYSNYLFDMHYLFVSKKDYFLAHKGFNDLFKNLGQLTHNRATHRRHKKIRLGYISSDFRQHVCLLFFWTMLTNYNKEKFEVYVFSRSPIEDKYSEYIKSKVDYWFNISTLHYPKAAKFIYDREIDILVDLAGHSAGNGLPILSYKPAPVQVCGIGYFATTGLQAVDYFLTDRYLVNDDTQNYFVEKLLVMPHSHFCYTPLGDMPSVSEGAPCKRKGFVTFGSFNNLTKVNDEVLAAWRSILFQLPDSRLILKGSMLSCPEGKELMRQKLLALRLPEERFELQPFTLPYLEQYYDIDIALDTFPYPGGGTTCDALYMGVPVITLGDGSHGGNFGISLLKNIGLDECCTYSVQEYIERAVLLASDYDVLEFLHHGLRNMMNSSAVLDSNLYMRDLENGYSEILEKFLCSEN